MSAVPPNIYRQEGAKRGVDPEIVERALTQARAPEEKKLPAILSLAHLAHLTGIPYAYLREVVERTSDPYRPFRIGKRNGGVRSIAAPEPRMLALQRWIAKNILNLIEDHPASSAYAPGSSPAKCAARHLGANWLIKVDIHDFFESITERAAWRVFRSAGYQPLVSLELARLCTREPHGREQRKKKWRIERRSDGRIKPYKTRWMGYLPQGAPTSPMLANLASLQLDSALQALADRYGLVYTRYSDDIAFSTGGVFSRKRAAILILEVERLFQAFGHVLHRKKISIAPPNARKILLGLLVDGRELRLNRPYRHRLADHVRGIELFGLAAHKEHRNFASLWGMVRHIEGLLHYAESIEGKARYAELRTALQASLKRDGWPECAAVPAMRPAQETGSDFAS